MSDHDTDPSGLAPHSSPTPTDAALGDMPPWARHILSRVEETNSAFSDVVAMLRKQTSTINDIAQRQEALERRMGSIEVTRTFFPVVALTLSVVAMVNAVAQWVVMVR